MNLIVRGATPMSEENTKKKKHNITPEIRAKAAEAIREKWKDPEYRAKRLAHLNSNPEKKYARTPKKVEATAKFLAKGAAAPRSKEFLEQMALAPIRGKDPELQKKMHEGKKKALEAMYEQVEFTPGMKSLCKARNLKENNVTYAQIAEAYLKYAMQGNLPFKICSLIAEEFKLPSITMDTMYSWSIDHPEIKEAMKAGKQYIAMAYVDYMRKGLGIDKVKWMLNVFCDIYETSAMKHNVNASVEVKGEIQVKAVSLGDLRQKKE